MLPRIAALFFLFLAYQNGLGQVTSVGGNFTIPHDKACAPYGGNGEIIIDASACDGSIACAIDFNYDPTLPFGQDGAFVREIFDGVAVDFSYTEPGDYIIGIRFGAGGINDHVAFSVLPGSPPDFNIYTCSGNRVQLEILSTEFPSYTIDYDNDNSPETNSGSGMVTPPHTYGTNVEQTIVVRPNFINCTPAAKNVVPVNALSNGHLLNRLDVTGSDHIDVGILSTDNILYQLDRSQNNGAFNAIATVTNSQNFTDTNVDIDESFYCYRLGLVNICDSPTPMFSNTICSAVIELDVQDGQNQVDWQTNTSGASSLIVNKAPGTPITSALNATGFTDTGVSCGTNYCYQLVMNYGSNILSTSKNVCGTAISSQAPNAVDEIASIVDGNAVELQWIENPEYTVSNYTLFRYPTHVTVPYSVFPDPLFLDDTYSPFQSVCYQVRFDDVCKNRSDRSRVVCPVELTATLLENNDVSLVWNDYDGYASGVDNYIVEKYNSEGVLVASFQTGGDTTFTDQHDADGQIFTYRVIAQSLDPMAPVSISNVQSIIKNPRLYHPTAFIPGSSIPENQTFVVKGNPEYISSYELKVFNRWGELVYFSTDMEQGWDGTFKGIKMPEGTYVFRTKVTDTAGRTFDYSGSVVLLKR